MLFTPEGSAPVSLVAAELLQLGGAHCPCAHHKPQRICSHFAPGGCWSPQPGLGEAWGCSGSSCRALSLFLFRVHFQVQEVVCPYHFPAPGAGSPQPLPEQHLGNRPRGHAFYCCCDYYCLVVDLFCALKECNHPQEQIAEEKLHLCCSSHCFPFLFIFLSRPMRGSEQKSEPVPAPCPHPEPEHCFALLGHPYKHHMLPLCFLLTCGASRS